MDALFVKNGIKIPVAVSSSELRELSYVEQAEVNGGRKRCYKNPPGSGNDDRWNEMNPPGPGIFGLYFGEAQRAVWNSTSKTYVSVGEWVSMDIGKPFYGSGEKFTLFCKSKGYIYIDK
jgi:hypothetical protein